MNLQYETVSETFGSKVKTIPFQEEFIEQFGDLNLKLVCDKIDNGQKYYMVAGESEFYVYSMFGNKWRKITQIDKDYQVFVKVLGCPKCGLINTQVMRAYLGDKTGWVKCSPCNTVYNLYTKEIYDMESHTITKKCGCVVEEYEECECETESMSDVEDMSEDSTFGSSIEN